MRPAALQGSDTDSDPNDTVSAATNTASTTTAATTTAFGTSAQDWLRLLGERVLDLQRRQHQQQQRQQQHFFSLSPTPPPPIHNLATPQQPPPPPPPSSIQLTRQRSTNTSVRHRLVRLSAAHHHATAFHREYTTILDDIDISHLLQVSFLAGTAKRD